MVVVFIAQGVQAIDGRIFSQVQVAKDGFQCDGNIL